MINNNKLDILQIFKESFSKHEVCKKLNYTPNGGGYKKVNKLIEQYNIDISHFNRHKNNQKYELIEKNCPVCKTIFTTKKGHNREKTTCSRACANTYFRSGENNPNWKEERYKTTCFLYHEHKCVICNETKILDVHHFDENTDNNKPENLIPLCPTHHRYWHSKYKNEVKSDIIKYRKKFIQLQNNK